MSNLRNIKVFVMSALIVPLMMFSFFAAGTMPSFSKQGIEILICTDGVVRTITVHDNEVPAHEESHYSCEWCMQINETVISETDFSIFLFLSPITDAPYHENPVRRAKIRLYGCSARGPPLQI